MIRDFLRHATPPLNELLEGKIMQVADAVGIHRQTAGRILRGYEVEKNADETLLAVAEEAARVLREQADVFNQKAEEIEEVLASMAKA